jgi:hypothetical protein
MPAAWPALPYEPWKATYDTLHAHTQVLGKFAVALAPPEPELLHAALRLTARGWETLPLPAPDGSGAFVVALDLHRHEAVVEHSDGRAASLPLAPDRSVGTVTRELIDTVGDLAGHVELDLKPQETDWTAHFDEDDRSTYDPAQVDDYFAAATRAAMVLAALRAPYRGRSTRVNAWWGSFDLAVSLYSGHPAAPPAGADFILRNSLDAQEIAVGWWPGDERYPHAAFYAYAHPAPEGYSSATLWPAAARWDDALGEYLLDWDDVRETMNPHATALGFARSAVRHACAACRWDSALAASVEGDPPPIA